MTITRKLGLIFGLLSLISFALVAWLAYREFIVEPAEFARHDYQSFHHDVWPELSAVGYFALMPVLLGLAWWWMWIVLAPLRNLTRALERIDSDNLREPLPHTGNGDEVDKLSVVFNSMTARLDESFRRVHSFSLSASHELKTPLTVMRAQIETVLRDGVDGVKLSPRKAAWLESQLDELVRLTQIVDTLMLLAKADSGLVKLDSQPVRLDELVHEAVENAEILAHPQQVKVVSGPCEEVVVNGDRHRLRQLLLILTDNAVKYNQPGGWLKISLRQVAAGADLVFTNTVAASLPEKLATLFDPFVRGVNAMGKVEGCGLGLPIARWIVQAHGGEIQMTTPPGDHSTVEVHLLLKGGQPTR